MSGLKSSQSTSLPPDLASWTRTLVKQYGLRAGSRLGQHFLVDRKVLADIIRAAELAPGRPVLEVGGGFGVLTLTLLDAGASVTVVELDPALARALRRLSAVSPQLTVLEGDVLKVRDGELSGALAGKDFSVVANLPYEISGAFLRRFLSGTLRPRNMTILLQKEVGERLIARPGSMSLISLLSEISCNKREIVRLIPPGSFWPAPKVTSCLMRLELKSDAERAHDLHGVTESRLWQLARIGFAARRKLLCNNLASALPLTAPEISQSLTRAQISLKARAQELPLTAWVRLAQELERGK